MSSTPAPPHLLIVCDYSMRYLGGAQTALIRQAEALAHNGFRVTLLAPGASGLRLADSIDLVEPPAVRTLPIAELPLFRRNDVLEAWVEAIIVEREVTAIMLHSEFGLTATTTAVAKGRGLPVLHTVHTFFWRAPVIAAPLAPALRALYRRLTGFPIVSARLANRAFDQALRQLTLSTAMQADVVLSPSSHQAERLRAASLPRVEVVSNVTEAVGPTTEVTTASPLKIAWIGRFAPEKRLPQAVAGVLLALEELGHGALELRIAGASPNRALARQTSHHPEVHWLGRLTAAQISDLIDSSDAVLLTSLGFDNQPMAALEAFSRSRPVVLVDPVLEQEFEGAAILTQSPEVAGIGRTLSALARDPAALGVATHAAQRFARRTTAAAHAAAIRTIIQSVEGRQRHEPSL